jgi:hypothetical protein
VNDAFVIELFNRSLIQHFLNQFIALFDDFLRWGGDFTYRLAFGCNDLWYSGHQRIYVRIIIVVDAKLFALNINVPIKRLAVNFNLHLRKQQGTIPGKL